MEKRLRYFTREVLRKGELELAWITLNNGHFSASRARRFIAGMALSSGNKNTKGFAFKTSGVRITLPLPLLWDHQFQYPLGKVFSVETRGNELLFKAEICNSGRLAWVEQVWQAIVDTRARCASVGGAPGARADTNGDFESWTLDEISSAGIGEQPTTSRLRKRRSANYGPNRRLKKVKHWLTRHARARMTA